MSRRSGRDPSHHVVVVGIGFGGLEVTHRLGRADANGGLRITAIDRSNHHLFQPLLYQAATASLAPSEIAWPIRSLLRDYGNVTTLLGDVVGVDRERNAVLLADGDAIPFDTLILATGAGHAYFGHDEWEAYAPGLKTLDDATGIRGKILTAFEKAERTADEAEREALLTFAVIGGGPTGVEVAGMIAELAHETLRPDFRDFDTRKARVILIEAGPRILSGFREDLSTYARTALVNRSVEVMLGEPVSNCTADGVQVGDRFIPARTIVWAAGVSASPAAQWLDAPADRAGRVQVQPDLTVPDRPNIFVIGDTATLAMPDGTPVPGIAPAAKQEGRYVAEVIEARLRGQPAPGPFRYKDSGSLATIGKRAAVVDFRRFSFTGWFAWWLWGIVHIYFLIGLRHRLKVILSWLWIYFTGQRSARLITKADATRGGKPG
ncbi:NAD(P)/FAD-dependent oxidoreductase [Enterovirga rhinocerotis]|uniref:NADH:ubiquinone reductase (non-electrogenic) n=1 Tax=Enterovirga rhinocerotis TaxID=1339210 RepID=A0A4V3DYQ9_9HYPH|nr:NAD(P)/FAD-dependent oxidoreductase [Enterovirga rhinocerotis]TDR93639.1 NADH dehydrogenase [Enterovirga rhinocerotis]